MKRSQSAQFQSKLPKNLSTEHALDRLTFGQRPGDAGALSNAAAQEMDGAATGSAAGETVSIARDFAAESARNPAAASAAIEHPGGVEREDGVAGRFDSSRGGATPCRRLKKWMERQLHPLLEKRLRPVETLRLRLLAIRQRYPRQQNIPAVLNGMTVLLDDPILRAAAQRYAGYFRLAGQGWRRW